MRKHAYHKPAMFLFLLGFAIFAASIGRSGMIIQSIQDLTDNSSHIVRAQVTDKTSQWDETESFIYTTVTLNITESLVGDLNISEEVTVFVPGGSVGDLTLHVQHAPRFEIDQDVIVFLDWKGEVFDVTSWEQGKFTIKEEQVVEKNISVPEFMSEIETAVLKSIGWEE
jgi:hypothetical protein